jgi:preprotein translocase subunit SecA
MRKEVLAGESLRDMAMEMADEVAEDLAVRFTEEKGHPEEWDFPALGDAVFSQFGFRLEIPEGEVQGLTRETLAARIGEGARSAYRKKEEEYGEDPMRYLERMFLLSTIDAQWKDHLLSMDHLKEGIGLRGYAQKDPLKEYQREGFDMFADLVFRMKEESLKRLFHVKVQREEEPARMARAMPSAARRVNLSRGDISRAGVTTQRHSSKKVGRNEPCPCGSGKKYKKCCGMGA